MEHRTKTDEAEKECIKRNETFWWNVDMRLRAMGRDSRSLSWLSREAGFPDSKLIVCRNKNRYEMRLKTVLRINEVLDVTVEDLFTPLLSSNRARHSGIKKDAATEDMELTALAITYLNRIPEIQAKGVLNHALSYLGRDMDSIKEVKNEQPRD